MLECGHIFCLECLQDFYNDAIEEGSVNTVRCLEPSCAKQRATASEKEGKKSKKPRTAISPSELLDIGVPEDKVKRYVMLKYKNELESDKSTIYCPRPWCGGAARSEKHKKPLGLDFAETSSDDGESDDTDAEEGNDGRRGGDKAEKSKASDRSKQPAELLAVCEDCHFAFCSRCMQTWHGEFYQCTPKATREELTEQEKASLEYLNLYTSPCPTCECRAQKTHGCNHMICPRCQTHFCYLCSEWLNPANPYAHYNPDSASPYPQGQHVSTKCHGRLWELEDGQGDNLLPLQARPDARARPQEPGQQQQQQQDLHEGHDEDGQDANHLRGLLQGGGGAGGAAGDGGEDGAGQILGYHGDGENPQRRAGMFQVNGNDNVAERNVVVVAREAPLVLRLMGNDGQARHGNGHHDNDNRNGHGNNNARGRGQGGRGARGGGPNAHQRRRPPVADAGEDQPDAAGADANAGRGGGAVRGFGNNMNNNRGRGRRGRGAGGGVRAGRARGAAGAGRGGAGGGGIRGGPAVGLAAGQGRDEAGQGRQEWGAAQEEWVARFVQMALVDIEDELDDDWDFEDEGLFLIN